MILKIFGSALAAFIIGFLMHGPIAGKLWMRLAGIVPTGNEKFSGMVPQLIWNFVANFVTAFVLYNLIIFTAPLAGGLVWYRGAIVGFFMWLGFIVPSTSIEVIWMGRKVPHWLFECMVSLVCFLAMGAIIAM